MLPIHETLDAVAQGSEEQFCSMGANQQGFQEDLQQWSSRVGIPLVGFWAALGLWGDSAPHTKFDSLYLMTYTCLSGLFRKRIWVAAFNKRRLCRCGCYGRHTYEPILENIAWSCRSLASGLWPSRDQWGRRWPFGSWRRAKAGTKLAVCAAIIASCGDWQWNKIVFDLTSWTGETPDKLCCWFCRAGFLKKNYAYDFRLNARWRSTYFTMKSYWEFVRECNRYVSPIWSIPGFVLSMHKPDFMHSCCLGILQYLLGSTVFELFQSLGGTAKKPVFACQMLENMSATAAAACNIEQPFHSLTLGMLKPKKGMPKMRLKATQARRFLHA